MGDVYKVLRFHWRGKEVDVRVKVDKCSLLDIVVDYEDEAKKLGQKLDFHFPTFAYVFKMKHWKLETDKDLMSMFNRLSEKNLIYIWVGTVITPSPLYKSVLNFREKSKCKNIVEPDVVNEHENDLPSLDDLEDTSVNHATNELPSLDDLKDTLVNHATNEDAPKPNITEVDEATTSKPSAKGRKHKTSKAKSAKAQTSTSKLPPPRRSPRFPPPQNITLTSPTLPDQSLFTREIPKTIAKRKGSSTCSQNVGLSTTSESEIGLKESRSAGILGCLTGKEMRATDEPVVKELPSQRDGSDDDPETVKPEPIKLIDLITDSDSSDTGETGMEMDNAASVPTKSKAKSVFSASGVPTQDIVIALPAPSGELIKKMKAARIRTRGVKIQ